jgi:hypothetical protein
MNGEDELLVGKNVDPFLFRELPHIAIAVLLVLSQLGQDDQWR